MHHGSHSPERIPCSGILTSSNPTSSHLAPKCTNWPPQLPEPFRSGGSHLQGIDALSVKVQGETDEVTVFCHNIWNRQKKTVTTGSCCRGHSAGWGGLGAVPVPRWGARTQQGHILPAKLSRTHTRTRCLEVQATRRPGCLLGHMNAVL